MTRAITSTELSKLRGRQSSRLYLALHQPSVIYTARVNQTVFDTEPDAIAYNTGSGTLSNVKPGMSMLVGTTAGAHDVGIVRIRKEPTSSVFFIGKTGGVKWENNLYLTVIDEFRPWPVPLTYEGGNVLLDSDRIYSNEHTQYAPVVVMGPPAVLWLQDGTATLHPSAADSWVLGSSITGYSWSAPGASTTSGMTTATPQITYNAAGQYRISCTVTAQNGKTATGYRRVFVFGGSVQPIEVKTLVRCAGDTEESGWSAEVEVVDLGGAVVRDGMLAVLFTVDTWGDTIENLGTPDGYGNILMTGWVDGDSITAQRGYGVVSFRILGTAGWLARMSSLPGVVRKSENAPSAWDEFELPTVNKALWHILSERSTLTMCTDVLLDADGRRMPAFDLPGGTLWEHIQHVIGSAQYSVSSDRCGRIYGYLDPALRTVQQRSTIPVVMDITKADWAEQLQINEQTERVSLLEISGIRDDTPEEKIISRAPGYLPRSGGDWRTIDGLVFDNQSHANFLSGQMLAVLNNRYDDVQVTLAMNNRFVDICPAQYVTMTLQAQDTPLGAIFSAAKFFIRRVEYVFDAGGFRTKLSLSKEVFGTDGVTILPEAESGDENVIETPVRSPNYPLFPPPRTDYPEYAPPPIESQPDCLAGEQVTGPYVFAPFPNILDTDGQSSIDIYVNCKFRDGTVNQKTMVAIVGVMQYCTAGIWYNCTSRGCWGVEALDQDGNVIGYGVNSFGDLDGYTARVSTFYPIGALTVDKIRIKLTGPLSQNGTWTHTWNGNYGWGGWRPADTTTNIGNDIYYDVVAQEWKVFRHVQTYAEIVYGMWRLRRDVPPDYTYSRIVYEFPKNTVRVIGGVSKTIVTFPVDTGSGTALFHLTDNTEQQPHSYQLILGDGGTTKTYTWQSWETGRVIEKITVNTEKNFWWYLTSVTMQDYQCDITRYRWFLRGVYLFNVCPV